jgi:hypothetical protein
MFPIILLKWDSTKKENITSGCKQSMGTLIFHYFGSVIRPLSLMAFEGLKTPATRKF